MKIIKHPESQNVFIGEDVFLNVQAIGPGKILYRWKKNGKLLSESSLTNISGSAGPELLFKSFSEDYLGSYNCTVSNEDRCLSSKCATLKGTYFLYRKPYLSNHHDAIPI